MSQRIKVKGQTERQLRLIICTPLLSVFCPSNQRSASGLGGEIARGDHFEVKSRDIWSQSILPALFMHLIANADWIEKVSPYAKLCMCPCSSLPAFRALLMP